MPGIDFKKYKNEKTTTKPVDPIDIFKQLPNLRTSYNDLLDGQGTTLKEWHLNREEKDILISLNTGAGKTLIGLLIAQSLLNEGLEKIVYVCSDNSLIEQTENEARKIGMHVTTRMQGGFSNDLYERGLAPCITNYQSLLNPFGCFKNDNEPKAIIFDDAHVAENHIRNQFTLSINKRRYENLFNDLTNLFEQAFIEVGKQETYKDTILGNTGMVLMAPVSYAARKKNELSEIFRQNNIADIDGLKYSYELLKDNLKHCAYFFGRDCIEITPPFIPAKSLNYFSSSNTRRIYLSATLRYKTDIIRAFGNKPTKTIEPDNSAGNGERLVLFSYYFKNKEFSDEFLSELTKKYKVLFSVPSYTDAERFEDFAIPPERDLFKSELNKFKESSEPCSLMLVARYDGIDLPDDECRIMVMDGKPEGSSLLEKFQYGQLRMFNFFENKLISRITQNFGRINRGKKDYSIHLINGYELNTKLLTPKFSRLFSEHLRKQINLFVNDSDCTPDKDINNPDNMLALIEQVLSRDEDWIKHYSDMMRQPTNNADIEKVMEREEKLEKSALNEVKYINALWNNNYADAINIIEETIFDIIPVDEKVAGWHNLWLGLCYELTDKTYEARTEYSRAYQRLDNSIYLLSVERVAELDLRQNFVKSILQIKSDNFDRKIIRNLNDLENPDATTNQTEESVRYLGEILGFKSTREDNQSSGGPDVLWRDEITNKSVPFELKTGMKAQETIAYYNKDYIGRGCQQSNCAKDLYPEFDELEFFFVGPHRACTKSSTPNENMFLIERQELIDLKNRYLAVLRDNVGYDVKDDTIKKITEDYSLTNIISGFTKAKLKELR